MTTSRQRRNHARSVRHRIEHQQLARQQEAREAQVTTPDEFDRDRELARITLSVYGQVPLSPPFYCRHIGLDDRCYGQNDSRRDEMPDVIRLARKPHTKNP